MLDICIIDINILFINVLRAFLDGKENLGSYIFILKCQNSLNVSCDIVLQNYNYINTSFSSQLRLRPGSGNCCWFCYWMVESSAFQ